MVTEDGIATSVNELHPSKALCPMLVTEGGIATFVNELQKAKALFPMLVTEDGMVTVFTVVLSTLHSSYSIVMVPSGILKCPSALTTDIFAAVIPLHSTMQFRLRVGDARMDAGKCECVSLAHNLNRFILLSTKSFLARGTVYFLFPLIAWCALLTRHWYR